MYILKEHAEVAKGRTRDSRTVDEFYSADHQARSVNLYYKLVLMHLRNDMGTIHYTASMRSTPFELRKSDVNSCRLEVT